MQLRRIADALAVLLAGDRSESLCPLKAAVVGKS